MTGFQLRVSNYLFTPKLIPSLVTFILFPVLISLGFWQLNRADEKRVIDHNIELAIAKMPLRLNELITGQERFEDALLKNVYRQTTIKGRYDNKNQFLLDNRTHLGKPGYHVLTPFKFSNTLKSEQFNTDHAVLINRGWITYNGTRDNIPSIDVDDNVRELLGQIKQVTEAIVLNNDDNKMERHNTKPLLIQSIQIAEISKELGYQLLPVVIELNKQDKDGFIREWQPYYGSIDKHNAYALQWFAMAAILLFLFIKLNTKKTKGHIF